MESQHQRARRGLKRSFSPAILAASLAAVAFFVLLFVRYPSASSHIRQSTATDAKDPLTDAHSVEANAFSESKERPKQNTANDAHSVVANAFSESKERPKQNTANDAHSAVANAFSESKEERPKQDNGQLTSGSDGVWPLIAFKHPDLCKPASLASFGLQVAVHQRLDYLVFCFGDDDDLSKFCKSGQRFFEPYASDFIVESLQMQKQANASHEGQVWYLDVGSNLGFHSLQAAASGFPVVAIEVQPAVAARLACSQTVNKMRDLLVLNAAVGDAEDELCLSNHGDWGGNFGGKFVNFAMHKRAPACQSPVRVHRLDGLLDDFDEVAGYPLPPPAVLKIDCEGCEWKALTGLSKRFSDESWRPGVILLESDTGMMRGVVGADFDARLQLPITTVEMLRRFTTLGYRVLSGDMKKDLTLLVKDPSQTATEYPTTVHFPNGQQWQCPMYVLLHRSLKNEPPVFPVCESTFKG